MGSDILGCGCSGHARLGDCLSALLLVAHPSHRVFDGLQFSHADSLVQLSGGLALQPFEPEIRRSITFQEDKIYLHRLDHRGFSYGGLLGYCGALYLRQLSGTAQLIDAKRKAHSVTEQDQKE